MPRNITIDESKKYGKIEEIKNHDIFGFKPFSGSKRQKSFERQQDDFKGSLRAEARNCTVESTLKRIKKLELKTRRLVNGLSHGQYVSVFKGRGIEFSEVREYQAGDDIRSIDWNVTARMNAPYVKEFIEERDLNVIILFDVSGSAEFGSRLAYKKEAGCEIAASIIFSAVRNNDNVGLLLSTNDVEKYLRPKKGKKHAMRLLRDMLCFNPKNRGTDIKKSLRFVSKVVKKTSIIFIISDFLDEGAEDIKKYLSILSKRHDVIAVVLRDERENELPDAGFVELEDAETGERLVVDTSDANFREVFKNIMEQKNRELRNLMLKNKIDVIDVSTSAGWEMPVLNFFRMRQKRCVQTRA